MTLQSGVLLKINGKETYFAGAVTFDRGDYVSLEMRSWAPTVRKPPEVTARILVGREFWDMCRRLRLSLAFREWLQLQDEAFHTKYLRFAWAIDVARTSEPDPIEELNRALRARLSGSWSYSVGLDGGLIST